MADFVELFGALGLHEGDDQWQDPEDHLSEDNTDPDFQHLEDEEVVAAINNPVNDDQGSETEEEEPPQLSHIQAFQDFCNCTAMI